MRKTIVLLLVVIGLGFWLSSCDMVSSIIGGAPATPPPPTLPDLPGYKTVEGQTLTDYIQSLGEEVADLADQPQVAGAAARIDQIIDCYQDIGAIQARIYSSEATPLSSGAVAIADRNALLDPLNLFNCLSPSGEFSVQGVGLQPCTASYTVSRDDNEYYILYAATTLEVCQAFCAQLEECTEHRAE